MLYAAEISCWNSSKQVCPLQEIYMSAHRETVYKVKNNTKQEGLIYKLTLKMSLLQYQLRNLILFCTESKGQDEVSLMEF